MKVLIVVDMQNDFVTGSLGTKEAEAIVPMVVDKINKYKNGDNYIIFTKDTHNKNYLNTLEGKKLPISHCIQYTEGWELIPQIINISENIVNKVTFGYSCWKEELYFPVEQSKSGLESIELCGLCTDICVISNALILRALYPNLPITVDAKCCAGVTPKKHKAALEVMKSCQIDVINE